MADAYLSFMGYLKAIYEVHAKESAAENFLRAVNNETEAAAVKPPNAPTT